MLHARIAPYRSRLGRAGVVSRVLTACVLSICGSARAQSITWTGAGGDGAWNNPSNWMDTMSQNRVPNSTDDVLIPDDANPNTRVTYTTGNSAINSLTCHELLSISTPMPSVPGSLTVQSTLQVTNDISLTRGALIANSPVQLSGSVNLDGGSLDGTGDVTITGPLVWTSGGMSGSGTTTIDPNGSMLISTANLKSLARVLNNGSVSSAWTGGLVQSPGGGTFNNLAGATFTIDFATNESFAPVVSNAGTIIKNGTGTITFSSPCSNSLMIDIQNGSLVFNGTSNTNSGEIHVASTAVGDFAHAITHTSSASLTGTGALFFRNGTYVLDMLASAFVTNRVITMESTQGGSIQLNAPYTFEGTVNLINHTLAGTGNITISGTLNWSGGEMSGAGQTTIAPTATVELGPPPYLGGRTLRRRLENNSIAFNWTAGQIGLAGATLDNRAQINISVTSAANLGWAGTPSTINNYGVINKSGAGAFDLGTHGSISFVNHPGAQVNVLQGPLSVGATTSNNGRIDAIDNAAHDTLLTFISNSTHTSTTSALGGNGRLTFDGNGNVHVLAMPAANFETGRTINIIRGGSTEVQFNADYRIDGMLNVSGQLGGSGILTIGGTLNWTSDVMRGTGQTIIDVNATAIVGTVALQRNVINRTRNFVWRGGTGGGSFGQFTNEQNAEILFELTPTVGDRSLIVTTLDNFGTITKTGARTLTLNALVNNRPNGVISVREATLAFGGSGTSLNNEGEINAVQNAILTFDRPSTHSSTSSLTGQGALSFTSSGHSLNMPAGMLHTNRDVTIGSSATVDINNNHLFGGASGPGTLNLSGWLGGAGTLTIDSYATLNWTGSMRGAGTTVIQPLGTMTLSTALGKVLRRTLENLSITASWTGGDLEISRSGLDTGQFINRPGAVFSASQSARNISGGSPGAFSNEGRFVKNSSGTMQVFPILNNSGQILIQTGMLEIRDNTGQNSSVIDIAGGTSLRFIGGFSNYLNIAGSSITGNGMLELAGNTTLAGTIDDTVGISITGGTMRFNAADESIGSISVSGGTLDGTGILRVLNSFTWSNGTMSGNGRTYIAPGANPVMITDGTTKSLRRVLEIASPSATWDNGNIDFNNGTLRILAGATLSCPVASNVTLNMNTGGTSAFVNSGTFERTGGGVVNLFVPITSTGTISTSGIAGMNCSGTINIGTSMIWNGMDNSIMRMIRSGIRVTSGPVSTRGIYVLPGSLSCFTIENSAVVNCEDMTVTGGTVTLTGTSRLNVSHQLELCPDANTSHIAVLDVNSSGATVNAASIVMCPRASIRGAGTVIGNITNSGGTISPGNSPGRLNVQGNYTQGAAATLDIELGGRTSGTQYDVLSPTGTASLDGTLRVSLINGFTPISGDTFAVVTAGTRLGRFSGVVMSGFPPTLAAHASYTATQCIVTVGACAPCDVNCDEMIDASDIQTFIARLEGAPGCSPCAGDANANGNVESLDLPMFVDCLLNG